MAIMYNATTGPHSHTVWRQWANVGYTTTAGAITMNPTHNHTIAYDPWRDWVQTTTTGTTGMAGATVRYHYQDEVILGYDPAYTWEAWDEIPHEAVHYAQRMVVAPQPTQEELDAAQRRREEESARRHAAQAKLEGAQERALELLHSLLTEEQLVHLVRDEEIPVTGSDGGMYVIEAANGRIHGNIRQVDEHGCVLGRLCVQPVMYDQEERASLPSADGHVGQLLAIRFNEAALRERANWSGRRACQQPDVPILRAA
jgi:hypothetical protein